MRPAGTSGARAAAAFLVAALAALAAGCAAPDPPGAGPFDGAQDRPTLSVPHPGPQGTTLTAQDAASAAVAPAPPAEVIRGPLTLERARAIALERNPRLLAAGHGVEAARGREAGAGLWPNPTVDLAVEEGPLYRTSGRSNWIAGVTQPIVLGGRLGARRAAAAKDREAAEAGLAAARRALVAEVDAAFARALFRAESVSLAAETAGLAARSRDIASRRVAAGDAPEVDRLRAEIEVERVEIERSAAEGERLAALRRLAELLGAPLARGLAVEGALSGVAPPVDLDAARALVLRDHPSLDAAARASEGARLEVAALRAERVPDVGVRLGGGRTGDRDEGALEVGLVAELPLFDRRQGAIAEAEARAARAAREAEAARAAALGALGEAHARYEVARERVRRGRKEILPRAARALDETQRGYEAGKFGLVQLVDAQRTLFEARARQLEALLGLALARADLGRWLDLEGEEAR